jgi:hypothetical protein
MSGLSEIDIKDFERMDVKLLRKTIKEADIAPDLYYLMNEWCNTLEEIQRKLTPQVAALFKPKE